MKFLQNSEFHNGDHSKSRFTHSMPFPCRAVPLRVWNFFPVWFTQCGRVWFTLAMPCSDHAVLLKATAQHVRQQTACGLPARFRLLPATTRSSTNFLIGRIRVSDTGGQCETKHRLSWTRKRVVAAHYKKDDLLHFLTSSSDISGYHADIHEVHGTVGAGQGRGMACVN